MSRHRIDASMTYAYNAKLPVTRMIEDPEIEPVPPENPPQKEVEWEPYLPDEQLQEVVNLAIALGRPLLLQGDPGCGKTRLAYSVAYALGEGLPLEECYIKSTSRAQDLLYTYDAVNRLYDSQLKDPSSREISNYIHFGPLGRAIIRAQYGRRSVVLIDEIDKADLDFPNDLLLELDRLEFRVAEAPAMHYAVPADKPELRPIVFVTHNEEKALPTAFLRRCIFHYVKFPEDEAHLRQILSLHEITNEPLSRKAIEVLLRLRKMELSKNPGLSELIDWVSYMQAVKTPVKELEKLPYIGVLLKQQIDQQRARK
ncbi:ATPase associated with various cellular activities AAA_5 [Candidatus Vecturithrix granuli]|uniref:ATPase associated with various cellular activities AAA_5 n=1 Tax=Vecturithrix granuli TaxID=1499967 RepID=A0A081C827_VECG1|nr:ATPase associated with various cellular activities AAA_5 [Candidatus Vecturithrix granuli]